MLSLSSVILYALVALMFFYASVMIKFATHTKNIKKGTDTQPLKNFAPQNNRDDTNTKSDRILTAYLEPIDESQWKTKPLPVRTSVAEDLNQIHFPKVNSCSKLIEQWPVDEYPDADPFLPWIHDVFPSHDGKFIQIVAQNRRRCNTGKSAENKEIHRKRGGALSHPRGDVGIHVRKPWKAAIQSGGCHHICECGLLTRPSPQDD